MFYPQEKIAERLKITPETKVLDVGGGNCQFHYGDVTIVDILAPN